MGQRCHDSDKNFALSIHRVNGLFFKQNRNVHVFELSDVFQTIQCVSGQTADRFGNNHINITSLTVINHVIKFFTFFCISAGDAVIGINTGKFPMMVSYLTMLVKIGDSVIDSRLCIFTFLKGILILSCDIHAEACSRCDECFDEGIVIVKVHLSILFHFF